MFEKEPLYLTKYFNGKITKSYGQFRAMINRCSSGNKREDYQGSSVTPEWLTYSDWLEWAKNQKGFLNLENNGRIWCLDKDILKAGNKHYCPENCVFIPNMLNAFFKPQQNNRELPLGVYQKNSNSCFSTHIPDNNGKRIYLGSYETKEEAHEVYLVGKSKLGEHFADIYDGFVDVRVLEVVGDFKTWFKSLPNF